MVFITFIIPSIGRISLNESLKSLIEQKDEDWNAIVIFDGVKNNINIIDNRIKYIEIEKIGKNECKSMSGLVRNIGLNMVDENETEWVGFLDDDDSISDDYIIKLKEEININDKMDVCIFRMKYPNGYVLPPIYEKIIRRNYCGISFVIKSIICKKITFQNNPFEDYIFLKELENKRYNILISSYVTYYIKQKNENKNIFYPKVKINF